MVSRLEQEWTTKTVTIQAVKDFIARQRTWFKIDDESQTYILYATREHGHVGEEYYGEEDYREAKRLGKLLHQQFGRGVELAVEDVDEWVHLTVHV